MTQRARNPHRGTSPSSATQLPILATLHARFPTLFGIIILYMPEKVNPFFTKSARDFQRWKKFRKRRGFVVFPWLFPVEWLSLSRSLTNII